MSEREEINQYDLVEIIHVPEQYEGIMDIGDVGVVVEMLDKKTFVVECVQPGGSTKWLEKVNAGHVQLRSRDPYHRWIETSLPEKPIMQSSIVLGMVIGGIFGGLLGIGFGAVTRTFNGILIGLVIGLMLGGVTGVLTAALTVKTAGTTGGIGVGYFTGMVFGGVFGMLLGALIPTSLRLSANTQGVPVLDVLIMGRFETAMLISFLLSILGTMVGTWVGGKNLVPRNLKERYRP